ncbi:MAG: uracil-DNA glycosylase [Thermodesulfobacteriota bacterium]|nr:uracil-DNA glycosylase [Thermodesulfobacteriota bacterium]
MESDCLTDSVQAEFFRLVNGAAGYFRFRKEMGAEFLGISQKSVKKIRNLGQIVSSGHTSEEYKNENAFFLSEEGDSNARLFILTEYPALADFLNKKPCVYDGPAGGLLLKILNAMAFTRENVFTAGINPGDVDPADKSPDSLVNLIKKKVDFVKPDIILTFGEAAAKAILGSDRPVADLRGKFHDYNRIKVMPTFHPALLLKEPSKKRAVWEDVKMVMKRMKYAA